MRNSVQRDLIYVFLALIFSAARLIAYAASAEALAESANGT